MGNQPCKQPEREYHGRACSSEADLNEKMALGEVLTAMTSTPLGHQSHRDKYFSQKSDSRCFLFFDDDSTGTDDDECCGIEQTVGARRRDSTACFGGGNVTRRSASPCCSSNRTDDDECRGIEQTVDAQRGDSAACCGTRGSFDGLREDQTHVPNDGGRILFFAAVDAAGLLDCVELPLSQHHPAATELLAPVLVSTPPDLAAVEERFVRLLKRLGMEEAVEPPGDEAARDGLLGDDALNERKRESIADLRRYARDSFKQLDKVSNGVSHQDLVA